MEKTNNQHSTKGPFARNTDGTGREILEAELDKLTYGSGLFIAITMR